MIRRRSVPLDEVGPGIYRYGSRYINCYVIEDGGRLTLLDTGLPRYVNRLRGVLARLRRSVRDIEAILLTHCHVDHMGAAEQLRFESTGRVLVHENDAATVRGDRQQPIPNVASNLARPFFVRYLAHLAAHGAMRYPVVANVETFADEDRLDVPGSPRVVHVPGHTSGTCALVLEDRDVLFSADALVTLDTWTGATGPHVFRPPFTENHRQAIKSLGRFDGLEADVMLPGHGEPWRGPLAEAVAIARKSH